jgi:hypothetical protein
MLERDVVRELRKAVMAAGGQMRKVHWEGRRGAPDWLLLLPGTLGHPMVETKRPGQALEDYQAREHERLRAAGLVVLKIDSVEQIKEMFRGTH